MGHGLMRDGGPIKVLMAGFRLFLCVACVLVTGHLSAQTVLSPVRQQALVQLLEHDCGSCHGLTLNGGLGPPLTRDALRDKSLSFLENVILNGIPGSAMPPWKNHLTPQEVRWLLRRLTQEALP